MPSNIIINILGQISGLGYIMIIPGQFIIILGYFIKILLI